MSLGVWQLHTQAGNTALGKMTQNGKLPGLEESMSGESMALGFPECECGDFFEDSSSCVCGVLTKEVSLWGIWGFIEAPTHSSPHSPLLPRWVAEKMKEGPRSISTRPFLFLSIFLESWLLLTLGALFPNSANENQKHFGATLFLSLFPKSYH